LPSHDKSGTKESIGGNEKVVIFWKYDNYIIISPNNSPKKLIIVG